MTRKILALALLPLLAACQPAPTATVAPPPNPALTPSAMAPAGRTAAAYDRTTEAERRAALTTAQGGAALGRVSVALGTPTEQGFWLRSPLVRAERAGRVEAGGRSVAVRLLPGEGAAQLSLAAFRALGLSLTDLPEVTVYGS